MKKLFLPLAFLLMFIASLTLFFRCEKNPTQPADIPQIELLSPVKNQIIVDSVEVKIKATDDKGVTKVDFIVDNETFESWVLPPYNFMWDVTQLEDSSLHSVFAKAYDGDGNISTTPIVLVIVGKLLSPTDLSVRKNPAGDGFILTWKDNSKIEDGFIIERKEKGAEYAKIAEVARNVTSFIDNKVISDKIYVYRVCAFSGNYKSAYSNKASWGLFIKTFGGSNDDVGRSVQQTSDGGFIITGYTESYGAGNGDIWLIKTDASGNKLWDKTFGGSSLDVGESIQQTSDGGFIITGETYSYGAGDSDVLLIKTDASGNIE